MVSIGARRAANIRIKSPTRKPDVLAKVVLGFIVRATRPTQEQALSSLKGVPSSTRFHSAIVIVIVFDLIVPPPSSLGSSRDT